MPCYLDNAATTRIDPRVREAMAPWLDAEFGNPSSRHPAGVRALEALDRARAEVARAVDARPDGVVFTSGGTEANNLAVLGYARAARSFGSTAPANVVTGPAEHPSVRAAAEALKAEGFEHRTTRLLSDGRLDLDSLAEQLDEHTAVVAQMWVQNEFGSVFDVEAVVRSCRAKAPNAHVHVDAIQAFGKIEISLADLGAHSLALSAHKVHGPKGVGALVRSEAAGQPRPLVFGGGQERGLRSGTEAVASIVGFGAAARLAEGERPETEAAVRAARETLRAELPRVAGARELPIHRGAHAIAAVHVPGTPAEVWMNHLEARGIRVSAGSACQAKSNALSPALLALGLNEQEAREVLRISFCKDTLPADVTATVDAMVEVGRELEALRT